MLLHRKPGPPLSAFIDLLWHYRMPPAPHRFERILPCGEMSIVFNLTGEGLPGGLVCGAFSEYFTLDTAGIHVGHPFQSGRSGPVSGAARG